jgi:ribonuclease P protein component
MRRHAEFTTTVQSGRRGSSRRVVVHVAPGSPTKATTVGFVVPKTVGPAVERNSVKRRLRALTSDRLIDLPAGASVVVRALPAASGARSADLGRDLDAALAGASRRLASR